MFKKLKKGLLAGTIFSAAANMNGCVYGPPPESIEPSSEIQTSKFSTPSESETFNPELNENEEVYGPPEWFEGKREEEPEEDTSTAEESSFNPDENINACVYGPPEWFEGKGDMNE